MELSSISSIPVVDVVGDFRFGDDVYVIPEYSFSAYCDSEIKLSLEHK